MNEIGFGLIGTGFMGRAHAIALHAVATVFADVPRPRCIAVADADPARAAAAAMELGFARGEADWRRLLDDPAIDVIDICTPNHLHADMARAALERGKHVYCEKPLALDAAEAGSLAAMSRDSGRVAMLGLNYTTNPLIQAARELLAAGEIGVPTAFAGRYFEDYMTDAEVPFSWRCERALAGSGVLADLGSHLVNLLHFLLGPVARLSGDVRTVVARRRDPATGSLREVENEDIARAMIELESGVTATLDMSRVATGLKCGLAFDLFGSQGALSFDQQRMNELRIYKSGQAAGRGGYTTILAGPDHPDYRAFCPAPGHGLGINDLKIIEIRNLLTAIAEERGCYPDFDEGLRVQQVLDAIERSAAAGTWLPVGA